METPTTDEKAAEASPARNLLAGYLTEKEMARELGQTPRTLRLWRQKGTGPPWARVGVHVLYPEEGGRAWLTSRIVTPKAGRRA